MNEKRIFPNCMPQSPGDQITSASPDQLQAEYDYWHALISEHPAADFLGFSERTLQGQRQRGDGPKFIRISARCIRYRRIDLRAWAEDRLRSSTSDHQ